MVNKITLIGHVGITPEVRVFADNKVANFTLATSKKYKSNGEQKNETQWHNIVIWGKLAGIVEEYVNKGSKLYLEGEVKYRSYEHDGANVYVTEIFAYSMQMLDGKPKEVVQQSVSEQPPSALNNDPIDDLPF